MNNLNEILEFLKKVDNQQLQYELKVLRGIKEWALDHLGINYRTGDRVEIVSPIPSQSTDGWRAYAECLSVGATGIVKEFEFSTHHKRWFVDFVPDKEWSTSTWGDKTRRYWNGPASETPQGFQPPSSFDQEHYPEGRKHTFMFNVEWLAK